MLWIINAMCDWWVVRYVLLLCFVVLVLGRLSREKDGEREKACVSFVTPFL